MAFVATMVFFEKCGSAATANQIVDSSNLTAILTRAANCKSSSLSTLSIDFANIIAVTTDRLIVEELVLAFGPSIDHTNGTRVSSFINSNEYLADINDDLPSRHKKTYIYLMQRCFDALVA